MAVTTSRKILVIDDEQSIVDLISDILSRIHCEPLSATKWVDAMEIIVRDEPDLIFLDLKMPTIDGATLLTFIRKQGLDVPVVVVSGYVTDDSEAELRKLGVSGIIRKPFQVKQITGTIEEILGPAETPDVPDTEEPPAPAQQESESPSSETPATTDALYEAPLGPAPEPAASSPPNQQPAVPAEETPEDAPGIDSLYSLSKDDSPPTGPVRQKPTSADEVLEALKKANPPSAPSPEAQDAPASSEAPKAPPVVPILPTAPASTPASPQPVQPAAEQKPAERSFEEAVTARPSLLPTVDGPPPDEHRRHHRRSRGSRKSRRQTAMLMSVITVVCILVAGFLAVMRHYASQVDLEQLKKNATRSAADEAATKVLKEKLLEEIGK